MAEKKALSATYFSHSWRSRDTDLNIRVWQELADYCELLVDVPEEVGPNPPYYINRIEELLRQSDLFICVLTDREEPAGDGQDDGALRCSAYSLFEIRLAERLDIPRLVLYERGTGFRSPRVSRPKEAYIAFNRGADELPDDRFWRRSVAPKIQEWLKRAIDHHEPAADEQFSLAVSLLPPGAPDSGAVRGHLEESLKNSGYEQVAVDAAFRTNMELFQLLRVTGLAIMDLGSDDAVAKQLNCVVHTLGIPAIRMMRGEHELPWLFRGHPGGYQQDIVTWQDPAELPELIEPRANAMFGISHSLKGDKAFHYLESKRYSQEFIFISHTLKPPHRTLVERLYDILGDHYVKPFEYHMVNKAGIDWKVALNQQLRKTTVFVALLTEGYEVSEVCTYELEEIMKRGKEVKILPFMAAGRTQPHPKLGGLHHRLLKGEDVDTDASVVAEQVMEMLRAT
ncbi:MAG: toll/interleukin-1 receptor domain-containing protein [Planctomycetota bacterium]|jgi:hypothetical protein